MSQSLWVRDRFLIHVFCLSASIELSQSLWVRDRFLIKQREHVSKLCQSQSLWVRDRFLILADCVAGSGQAVAIPLGQGQVFNTPYAH